MSNLVNSEYETYETERPWVVFNATIPNPGLVIEKYGDGLRDLSGACSEGEIRVVDGRQFKDEEVKNAVMRAFKYAANKLGIVIDHLETLEILHYTAGGEYSWHADNEWTVGELRKLSIVITLNADFEGGGTEFMWPRPGACEIVRPGTGGAVVFPAPLYHRAVRTDAGERWVVVGWATGPRFT